MEKQMEKFCGLISLCIYILIRNKKWMLVIHYSLRKRFVKTFHVGIKCCVYIKKKLKSFKVKCINFGVLLIQVETVNI